jgi:hypothetical protein
MSKPPKPKARVEDAVALALFAQRSPNADFRERAFALALASLGKGGAEPAELRPLWEFAARSKAKGESAELARATATRLMREAGHAELRAQLAASTRLR